jgi:hypothetical protein
VTKRAEDGVPAQAGPQPKRHQANRRPLKIGRVIDKAAAVFAEESLSVEFPKKMTGI